MVKEESHFTCVDVVGRFFGHPVFGSVELVGFMATLTVVLALPYTHQARAHIGVEIVMRLLPERVQAVVEEHAYLSGSHGERVFNVVRQP